MLAKTPCACILVKLDSKWQEVLSPRTQFDMTGVLLSVLSHCRTFQNEELLAAENQSLVGFESGTFGVN